ncbi:MAG: division/cell wall cluster transcriptional repressor MraZ [Dehalococcoidales bacterium]|jgi:MraZ protein|nr:division/cell wall cluster transcriptional repressor MraZ [Dehalococcoidales bacterium]
MFFGEFEYKIDEKGRLPLPPKFRGLLKGGVVLAPGIEKCITAYPILEWKKLAEALTSGSVTRSKLRRLSRAIFATAFHLNIDGQGRISLPAPLRAYAEITDEVVVAGANSYLELWNRAHWEEEKATSQQQAWQIIESLERD